MKSRIEPAHGALAGMGIKYWEKHYGGKLCIIGNVDVDLLSLAPPKQVSRYFEKLYRNGAE